MAGSLNHIIGTDGRFSMDLIENMRDAAEALSECYDLIWELSNGSSEIVSAACRQMRFPDPWGTDRHEDDPMPPAMIPSREE